MRVANVRLVMAILVTVLVAAAAHGAANPPTGNEVVGDCGDTTHGPGCSNAACEACVCDQVPECCSQDWNQPCLAAALSCPAECFAVVGNCGDPRVAPGCNNAICEACVCNQWALPTCCTGSWSESCAQAAVGVLGDNTICQPACLLSNRPEPAPVLSPVGVGIGVLALTAIAWRRRARRLTRAVQPGA